MHPLLRKICAAVLIAALFGVFIVLSDKQDFDNNIQYTTHIVKQGETLWTIVKQYNPGEDPRPLIYEVRKINHVTPIIMPGQKLIIPIVTKN